MSVFSPLAQWLAGLASTIHHGHPAAVGVAVAALTAGSAYCSWRTWRNVGIVRLIEDTPSIKIRSAPQGYVEIEGLGKLMDGPPIIAKLSGLPCVWYRYKVEQYISNDRNRPRWETVDKGESTEIFWLQDETGRIVVDPEGAEVTPKHKDIWKSRAAISGVAYPKYLTTFLAANNSDNSYRFTEERINSGERLYAIGLLKNVSSYTSTPTVDEDARMLLTEWKQDQPALLKRFDLNRDEKIDDKEWMLARAQARREVMKSRRDESHRSVDGLNVLGPTRNRHRPYLLSAFTQGELAKRYQRWAAFYAVGCFMLGLATVWVFNAKFI
jgi:hypothetical protein